MKKLTTDIITPISDKEKNEEIEYIWVVVANMNWRAPVLTIQTIIGLVPIVGLFTSIFPRMEHHGIVFKTKNGNYYTTDFVCSNSKFINFYKEKEKAFNFIAERIEQKKIWISLKAIVKSDNNITIGEISNIINKVTPKEYNLIFENCQSYVKYIINNIYHKIKILGFDSGWTSGHMCAGIQIGGDRSY